VVLEQLLLAAGGVAFLAAIEYRMDRTDMVFQQIGKLLSPD
jgi:hypothetical protein